MMTTPATPGLAPLDRFVGTWDTEGQVGAGESAVRFEAVDEYEWLAGGYFLVHKFRACMPDGETSGIEVISHDPPSNTYAMRSFDNAGSAGVMIAHHEGDHWVFLGEHMRFSGAFSPDGREFSGVWEMRSTEAATWQPWMTVKLLKRPGGSTDASNSALQPT
jgi:hypothetical protein